MGTRDFMNEINENQHNFWTGEFGKSYLKRNYSVDDENKLYLQRTGLTYENVFQTFFHGIDRHSKILELGCNVGIKLSILKKIGFTNLHGVEINKKAFQMAKTRHPDITFSLSSIEDFKGPDEEYDLVYTSGVLIHINPKNLDQVIKKIIKLTKKYVFGLEYFSENLMAINYRGVNNVLWKQNFPKLFIQYPNITMLRQKKFFYKDENLCDIAYLLKKS